MEEWQAIARHLSTALRFGLVPLLAIAFMAAALAGITFRRQLVLFAFLFGLVGGGIGMLLGASRSPAVSAVLPAIVTVIGGLVVAVFPRQEVSGRLIVPAQGGDPPPALVASVVAVSIAALMLSAVTGANFGAAVRGANEAHERALERRAVYDREVRLPLGRAQLRRAMGLPLDAP